MRHERFRAPSGATWWRRPSAATRAVWAAPRLSSQGSRSRPLATQLGAFAMLDLSVVVPARNAEDMLDECLAALARSEPREIIVFDGMSTDNTVEIARRHGARVLQDEGKGLPAARHMGAEAAVAPFVALIDADVVVGDVDLAQLLEEHRRGGYTALQAGLHSVSGDGYWGQALAYHRRTGRSKEWFGVVATIFEREALLEHGFDARFLSG